MITCRRLRGADSDQICRTGLVPDQSRR